ncbi:MAG TPA: TVP38/TMEM64 family protein [Salinimicrobium sp.]|nr:TVP38/TMEM64 family protein [Salinimicrobium sp.]
MPEKIKSGSVNQSKLPLYISIGIIATLILTYFFVPSVQDSIDQAWDVLTSDDEQRIQDWVSQFGFWGPIIIVVAMVLQMFLIVIPTPLLMIVSILAYGPIWGSVILLIAIFVASTIGYFIGRYFGSAITDKIIGHKTAKHISSFIEDYGFWTIIVVRLSPFLSNDAISFVAGILKMGYWRFIGATLIGISPLIVFIAFLGENYQRLKSGLIWGSIICIVLFVLFVIWDKKFRKSKK